MDLKELQETDADRVEALPDELAAATRAQGGTPRFEQSSDFQLNSGLGQRHGGLPRLLRTYLSRAAFALLEALRLNLRKARGFTTYQELMFCSGLRSRASVAKALKELAAVGAIWWDVRRERNGRVSGIRMTYLGLPVTVSEHARQAFTLPLRKRISTLQAQVKEIENTDREPPQDALAGPNGDGTDQPRA